ncbi:MAG: class I SAM-dependent RNA methyltransferase [Microcella sp.]|uniref:class I SAM-dependent RNA methyltransferase n=1 Tax=Microcella sp. TaxID=1913979 RepID=UPI0024C90BE8|nr:TRAM domain-containing protein [Microcella sp.]UYN82617.1 MAG: class I SAM-dependent RNA methyltransferase [Microcella sp.]
MGEHIGTEIELTVDKIAHGGIAVGRLDGRVVFVSDAIPGETVRARVSDDRKKSFWRADAIEVLSPSEHRRDHIWGAAAIDRDPRGRAGGAEFGHIALEHQRELKRQVLAEALQRMAGLESDVVVEALPGDDAVNGLGWRTRIRLHVDDQGRLGPMASRSHSVIPVTDAPLATPAVQAAAPFAERFLGYDTVDVLAPSGGDARLVLGDQKPTVITERVGERVFRLDDTGFWQVHRSAAVALTDAVQQAIDESLFDPRADNLDLYGGVGLLAAAVADRFGASTRITSVESDERATDHASENLAEWLGASAESGRVDRWLRSLASSASAGDRGRLRSATVVLDPPRSGAGTEVMGLLTSLEPAQLVYVACDPVALARDVALAAQAGYSLSRIRAFDLFPHTHHVEAVATLVRA